MKRKIFGILFALVLVVSFSLVTAVPVGAQVTEVWVDDDYTSATPTWGTTHFDTIQAGITAVATGGTVNVAAGTYNAAGGEVFPLIIDVQNLTLTAAGAAENTVIDSGVNDAIIITGAGVTVNGFKIEGGSPTSERPISGDRDFELIWFRGELIHIKAAATISNCVIDSSAQHHGIMGDQTATIVNNTIGGLASGFGIKLATDDANGSTIENNLLEGQTLGVQIAGCDDITIKDNVFRNNTDPTPGDKWIDGCGVKLSADLTSISNVSITGNTFSGNDLGIMLEEYVGGMVENGQPTGTDTTITGVVVHQNNFEDNTNYGIATYFADTGWTYTITPFGETVDAENNWWGDATGADHTTNPHGTGQDGDKVTDNVDFTPWYATATTTSTTQNVSVDHTVSSIIAYSDTIQGGIDAALTGDTIKVYPGTYAEALDINEEVTLTGVDANGNNNWTVGTAGAGTTAPTIAYGTANNFVKINADNVTIQGFKIDASTYTGMNAGIYWNGATTDEATIQYCTLNADNGDRLINLADSSIATDFTITYNAFTIEAGASNWGNWFATGVNGGCFVASSTVNVLSYNSVVGQLTSWLDLGIADQEDITWSNNDMDYGIVLNETEDQETGQYGDIVVLANTFAGAPSTAAFEIASTVEDTDWENGSLIAEDVIINYNDFTGYAATGPKTINVGNTPAAAIDAQYNYWGDPSGPTVTTNARGTGADVDVAANVDYEPWLHTEAATVVAANTRYYAYNWCDLTKGWNIWSTPIAMDVQADTWKEYRELGVNLDLAGGSDAYYFNGSSQSWANPGDGYELTPCDALYIKVASNEEAPILFSADVSAPAKTLYAGWNLVSASYIDNMDEPTIANVTPVEDALASVYYATGASNIGYSVVTSPAVNQTAWSGVRKAAISDAFGQNMVPTKGYWVHMVNGGTLVGEVFTPVSPLLP